jgi:hypothetical protein
MLFWSYKLLSSSVLSLVVCHLTFLILHLSYDSVSLVFG